MAQVVIYLLLATAAAVVLDLVIMRWAGRRLRPGSGDERNGAVVRVFGAYSPVLTWLKYRRLPAEAAPSVSLDASAPLVEIVRPCAEAESQKPESTSQQWRFPSNLALGVGLTLFGLYAIARYSPVLTTFDFVPALNEWLRVDVVNLDNVLVGVALLLVGGWQFGIAVRGMRLAETGPEAAPPHGTWPALDREQRPRWLRLAVLSGLLLAFLLFQLRGLQITPLQLWIWLGAIGLLGLAAWRWDRAGGVTLRLEIARAEIVLLLALVVGGLLVTAYQLQDVPNILMGDEGDFFTTAKSIAAGEYRPSPFDFGVYSYPVLSGYWQGGILWLFGPTLWAWRFASVLAGVLAIVPLYCLGRELFGRRVAVLAAGAMVTAPYFLAFARLGYNNSQAIFPVTLSAWLLYSGLKRKSMFYVFLGGAAAGLGFLTYTAGRLAFVFAALYFGYVFLGNIRRATIWRSQGAPAPSSRNSGLWPSALGVLPLALFFFAGWATVASPHLVYGSARDPSSLRYKMLESLFASADTARAFYTDDEIFSIAPPLKVDGQELFFHPGIYARLLLRGLVRTLLVFYHKDLVTEHFIASPLAGPVAVGFYTLGLALLIARLRERRFAFLALWFGSGLVLFSAINTFPPRHQHLVPIIPVMALLIGLGLEAVTGAVAAVLPIRPRLRSAIHAALLGLGIAASPC
ncbi:MAG: glycosyltransferase family 39 protein [Chloroflexi bacterium]|nr:glycosyltransferase family 39 protein [Chloroflexota bacterium]